MLLGLLLVVVDGDFSETEQPKRKINFCGDSF